MTLKHGKFLIGNESIFNHLELPLDSYIEARSTDNGIEIYVLSDEEHDLLVDRTSNNCQLKRIPIYLNVK